MNAINFSESAWMVLVWNFYKLESQSKVIFVSWGLKDSSFAITLLWVWKHGRSVVVVLFLFYCCCSCCCFLLFLFFYVWAHDYVHCNKWMWFNYGTSNTRDIALLSQDLFIKCYYSSLYLRRKGCNRGSICNCFASKITYLIYIRISVNVKAIRNFYINLTVLMSQAGFLWRYILKNFQNAPTDLCKASDCVKLLRNSKDIHCKGCYFTWYYSK